MSNQAWVTLATNDSYGLGALVLAHSLRRVGSAYPAVVLITPSVTEAMRERLRAVFAEVVVVNVLDSQDATHLALLQRPELGITFTKIHCWNLTQYEKAVFLDADTLVVQNCDELFEREELSAAPDVGWPDCFNSGVFVFKPSAETFSNLITFASERGSFDGGDQGLLNSYFSDWAHGDIKKHLPFLYNVTSAAFYSYLPALKHFGQNLKIIHFIGAVKPWLQQFNWASRSVEAPEHLRDFLQLWWDLFVAQVHAQLDTNMTGVAANLARVVPGAPLQQDAVDELARRQGWEAGNIDYMGADSFDNIWAKISQTLNQPASQSEQSSEPQPKTVEETVASVEAVSEKQPLLPALEKEVTASAAKIETEVPKSTESELVGSVPVEVPTSTKESKPVEIPVPAAEAKPSGKIEEPIPVPVEMAAEVPEIVDVVAPVESSSPIVVTEQSEQSGIPVAALEALKIDEPLPEALLPVTVVEQPPVPEPTPEAPLPVTVVEQPPVPEPTPEAPLPVTVVEQPPVPEPTPEAPLPVPVVEQPPVAEPTPEAPLPVTVVEQPPVPEPTPEAPLPVTVVEQPPVPEPTPEAPAPIPEAAELIPETSASKAEADSDSPPLANTPSKEEIPEAPIAKSEERRKPVGKLQLRPPVATDPLPTPDSELEDAATLAHAIIAGELRTPTVTAPSPPAHSHAAPADPAEQLSRLSVQEPEVPTPPVGSVALSQIGVKPKPSTAAQIESSVSAKTEAAPKPAEASDAPKKKVVKKVLKKDKEGASNAEAPVPPPRKKEKKPKEK
ncbi:glycogenin-2-like isoform X5 [Vanessa atalanta]|uniref:glycogenin-2-like isoform X5 n=1 Tax=Vanessa atalanta TaxID=42275 RepID=UPI001FCD6FDD|nr:glycogenin-2-like isoform X5 [Vanessa atalanta]